MFVEILAILFAKLYHENRPLYRIFTPLELAAYCLYLNYSIRQLRRWHAGWIVGLLGIITAIAFEFVYPDDIRGEHFLLIENTTVICLCLYAFYIMLLSDDEHLPLCYIHFWLIASTTFFFCFSFLSLALAGHKGISHALGAAFDKMIFIANIGMLIGVLYAYIRLPKLLPAS